MERLLHAIFTLKKVSYLPDIPQVSDLTNILGQLMEVLIAVAREVLLLPY
jgi:hypothetical protein